MKNEIAVRCNKCEGTGKRRVLVRHCESFMDKTNLEIQRIICEELLADGVGIHGKWLYICASKIKDAVLKMEGEKTK